MPVVEGERFRFSFADIRGIRKTDSWIQDYLGIWTEVEMVPWDTYSFMLTHGFRSKHSLIFYFNYFVCLSFLFWLLPASHVVYSAQVLVKTAPSKLS